MFDAIHDALLRDLNPRISRDQWRRIFDYGWDRCQDYVGHALVDGGVPVGFVGLIFANVPIAGRLERFCNVTSWTVRESHRARALSLVMPLLKLRDHTITNLTAIPQVHTIFAQLGFGDLETHTTVLSAMPPLTSSCRGVTIITDPNEIAPHLGADERHILEAHRGYTKHLLIRARDRNCYVVYTRGRRRKLPSAKVHYLGDEAVFAENVRTLQMHLLLRQGLYLIEFDSRLLTRPIPFSRAIPLPVPRQYRSATLKPREVTNLFSEVVLLNF